MIELTATAALTLGSALLLAYWFRYSCILILNAQTARDYARVVALDNQLAFREVQSQLPHCQPEDFRRLEQALERDYAVVQALLGRIQQHESILQSGLQTGLETGMLHLYYRLQRVWFSLSRGLSADAARQALSEMCLVVGHFANGVGEAAATA
jgi:hypothetical protein